MQHLAVCSLIILGIIVCFNQVDALSCYECSNCAEVSDSTTTINCRTQCIKYTIGDSDAVTRACTATSTCTVSGVSSYEAYCCNDKDKCNGGAVYKPGLVMVSMGVVVAVFKFFV